jgi:hypothetical protein
MLLPQMAAKEKRKTSWEFRLDFKFFTLEFLAKRLFYRSLDTVADNRKVLLATPLYVSLNS